MKKSVTTSIRLRPGLKQRLDRAAKRQREGRNRIVVAAIERYLDQLPDADLENEARRQSLRASARDREPELTPDWEDDH